jgi:chemotaxis signal transduction protein
MPVNDDTNVTRQRVLRRRAERLAEKAEETAEVSSRSSLTLARVGRETFAVPTERLASALPLPPIVPLPQAKPWIQGVAHVRGELVGVINLARWLQIETETSQAFLLVLEGAAGKLGLTVDAILGFEEIDDTQIVELSEAAAQANSRPVSRVTRDMISILDIDLVFASREIHIDDHYTDGASVA